MKVDVLLGLQWGDEGKGKIVDVLTPEYDVIARFQGGPNAGHTLEFDGIKHVLHTIPSGVFRPNTLNVVGNGVVIDPIIFKEIDALVEPWRGRVRDLGHQPEGPPDFAHTSFAGCGFLKLPKAKPKSAARSRALAPPTWTRLDGTDCASATSKAATLNLAIMPCADKHEAMLAQFDGFDYTFDDAEWLDAIAFLRGLKLIDSEHDMNAALKSGKRILAEGAQGTMLDIDFGTYPLRHLLQHHQRRSVHRFGHRPQQRGRSVWHLQGLLHARGFWPLPHRTCTMKWRKNARGRA